MFNRPTTVDLGDVMRRRGAAARLIRNRVRERDVRRREVFPWDCRRAALACTERFKRIFTCCMFIVVYTTLQSVQTTESAKLLFPWLFND